jgi:phosphatidylserine decarboxylase
VCVLFGPDVVESFSLGALPQAPEEESAVLPVRSHLATALRRSSD